MQENSRGTMVGLTTAVQDNGYKVLCFSRYTNPGDAHLAVVLAIKEDEHGTEECCWVYNEQTRSLFWGAYGETARRAYNDRVKRHGMFDIADEADEHCSVCDAPYQIDDNDKPGDPRWEGFCSAECMDS